MNEFLSAYGKLKQSIEKGQFPSVPCEYLTDADIWTALGKVADSLTIAQVSNLRRKLVKELRKKEDKSAADWISSQVLGNFPKAECEIKRVANKRVAVLHLNGKAEELPLEGDLSG